MKLNGPFVTNAISLPLWAGIRVWMSTLNCKAWYHDPSVDPPLCHGRPRIYLFWHENILLPLHLRGFCHVAMLLSKHRDADFLANVAGRFGFDCVRGSTQRGGYRALRELARRAESTHLTITPDGPRGPRRVCAAGPIYLASRLQMPIVVLGIAYQKPWRMRSWDRFAVPKPFSQARAILSEEIHIPQSIGREGIEHWRVLIEQRLNGLTNDAQEWADSGEPREGERAMRRATAPPPVPPTHRAAA